MSIPSPHKNLLTVVRNTSGGTRKFSFLPPHGRELAANEEVSYTGDLGAAISRGDHNANKRNLDALLASVDAGDLIVVRTPNPIFYDEFTSNVRTLRVQANVLSLTEPSWESD